MFPWTVTSVLVPVVHEDARGQVWAADESGQHSSTAGKGFASHLRGGMSGNRMLRLLSVSYRLCFRAKRWTCFDLKITFCSAAQTRFFARKEAVKRKSPLDGLCSRRLRHINNHMNTRVFESLYTVIILWHAFCMWLKVEICTKDKASLRWYFGWLVWGAPYEDTCIIYLAWNKMCDRLEDP